MKYLLALLFLTSLNFFAQEDTLEEVLNKYNSNSVPYIYVETLQELLDHNTIIILDAREFKEFHVSHIPGAHFVGYKKFSISSVANTIKDKNTPIVVYCSIGVRSEKIGIMLQEAGYTNIKNLYGGIFEWKNEQHSLVNSKNSPTDSVHTYSKEWSKWLTKGIKVYR